MAITAKHQASNLITRLTALWAVSESGLGGLFHAMKLPFSGLILGSFAVMIVTFLASHSDRKFRTIVQATLTVVLIKAIASPHSPFTAYVAVLFQGLAGALIYSLFRVNYLSSVIYGIIALMESALQKLLMLVLIFGKNLWEAFQEFFTSLAKQFGLQGLEHLPLLIVGGYCLIYFCGGILAGVYSIAFPAAIRKRAEELRYQTVKVTAPEIPKRKKKNKMKLLGIMSILFFIVMVFAFSGSVNKAVYSLLRTFAALALIYLIINPLFTYFLTRWKDRTRNSNPGKLQAVLAFVPAFRNHARTAYLYAEGENSYLKKVKIFLLTWMALALFCEE